ncbi:DUF3788 family protein [Pseudarthrobacter defluvii]|uniref:DUF3788 family protein n=1 Tax=Pseudarthrobacter defluvii TaxID=410837 RepID=UPI002576F8F4|nr:DUF3788 family protein [Pseudarthrobacter defluvii]WJH23360.1 DUF3788 family protein [Pseudarthrobacter defluvii]
MPGHVAVLTDPGRMPDDEQIRQHLGASFAAWQDLKELLSRPYLGLELSWHHYRDGGWLCKALRGSKNMAWLAVWDGYATVTCYFSARHRNDLAALPLPDNLRAQITGVEMSGAMLPVVVRIRSPEDIGAAIEVVRYKLRAR